MKYLPKLQITLTALFILLVLAACSTAAPPNPPVDESSATAAVLSGDEPPAAAADEAVLADPVEALLAQMTMAEKIGQMTLVENNSINPADIGPLAIGGLLSGGDGAPSRNRLDQWTEMVNDFQAEALSSRLGIPLLYGVDAIHGHALLRGATVFPHNIGLGATGDAELVNRVARATALETIASGIRWNFGPVLAVPQDVRWGRTYEGFSEDTALVDELGSAYLLGLQDAGDALGLASPLAVLGTPKHFIGDGGTAWGSSTQNILGVPYQLDQGDAQMSEAMLRDLFLQPYVTAIENGALSVMVSFSSWNGEKVHGDKTLLTDLLKDELGFTGFVVSDWGGVDQVEGDYYDAVVQAINAGVDMNMVPYDYRRFIDVMTEAVEKGDISEARIDDAVRRILRAKFALGLFETPYAGEGMESVVGSAEHRTLARDAVRRSLVLLQNEQETLPIEPDTPLIFLAGEAANDIGLQAGGWTTVWQGSPGNITAGTTIMEGLRAAAGPDSKVAYNRFGNFNREVDADGNPAIADVGIVVLAEPPYAEGVGDRADLSLLPADVDLLEKVAERSEKVVVVLLSGRPLVITEQLPLADAWVAAWLPGTEGDGISDVLYGDYPFTGALPYSWPRTMEQLPLAALLEDPEGPLFEVGFGLTTDGP